MPNTKSVLQIFSCDELNTIRSCLETQLDLSQSEVEDRLVDAKCNNGAWEPVGRSADKYFMYKDILDKFTDLTLNFTEPDYHLMLDPINLFIDMMEDGLLDSDNDLFKLLWATSAVAKIKCYLNILNPK